MVPVIRVTVLAFSACLVWAEPNWKIAFRLSLTLAGSYSPSSARAERPHAITMATSASPNKRRMLSPALDWKSVLHLGEPALRVGGAELCGALVPALRLVGLGRDVADVRGAEHGGIVGLRQHQRRAGVLAVGGALEQQSRDRDVAGGERFLRPLHQRCEFVGIQPPR